MSLTANSSLALGLNNTITGALSASQISRIKPYVDYSNFANFTFFSSAQKKVTTALTYILDNYPVGRTDGFYGTADFVLNDSVADEIDLFASSATDYEIYLLNSLGDPNNTGSPAVTSTLTAHANQSTSALRTVVNIPRDLDLLLTDTDQISFVENLLEDADKYDLGFSNYSIADQAGTASVAGIGSQVIASTTSESINREFRLEHLLPAIYFEDDNQEIMTRFLGVLGEVLDNVKVYIDQFKNLKTIDYNFPKAPQGPAQVQLADLLGFKVVDENLRQDFEKQLLRSGLTGDTSIVSIVDQLHERILNNLIYLYKHKGTQEALEALISCYGIPKDFLRVYEYATQAKTQFTQYTKEKDVFVLDYENNTEVGDRLILTHNDFDFEYNNFTI